jgi:hypothetical protein
MYPSLDSMWLGWFVTQGLLNTHPLNGVAAWNKASVVPRAGHNSRMNKGFASIWGQNNLPHAKFYFGVSRPQQGQSGKAGQTSLVL